MFVRIANLSSTSTFHNPEFTVIARGTAKLEFSKEHTTVRATPPANAANATAVNQAANAKVVISTRFNSKQRVFLDFVLSHYVSVTN